MINMKVEFIYLLRFHAKTAVRILINFGTEVLHRNLETVIVGYGTGKTVLLILI